MSETRRQRVIDPPGGLHEGPTNLNPALSSDASFRLVVDASGVGAASVALARQRRYAPILMDMQAPRLAGLLAATQQIGEILTLLRVLSV